MTQTEINHDVKEIKIPKKPNHNFTKNKNKELVKGKFHFHEVPGGTLSFSVRIDKGDNVANYTLVDQEIYSIPLDVYKHLNTNCWYPTYNFELDKDGKQIQRATNKVRRCGFHSLEFTDDVDLTDNRSNIIGIERM